MIKLIIGLLIIAAGAGVFFYLQKEKREVADSTVNKKELLGGKWRLDTYTQSSRPEFSPMVGVMALVDSNSMKYDYEFTRDGSVLRSINDSIFADTSHYEWKKDYLLWKDNSNDSTGIELQVVQLNKDSLSLLSADSIALLFVKKK